MMDEKTKGYIEFAIWIIIILLALSVGHKIGLRKGLIECEDYQTYVETRCICPQPIQGKLYIPENILEQNLLKTKK